MTTLLHRRITPRALGELISEAPVDTVTLTDEHLTSFAARLRGVSTIDHRRLDAWAVERAAQPIDAFHWTPQTAKRALAGAALRRGGPEGNVLDAVRQEIATHLERATAGWARPGSLSWWLANSSEVVRSVTAAEASASALQLREVALLIPGDVQVASTDAYYDVPGARTSLRGRRDLVVTTPTGRVVLRVRGGAPGKSAGPGLRADLFIDAASDPLHRSAQRIIGLWPDAGVMLSVDGTMSDLRSGARDLVRSAVVRRAQQSKLAA